MKIIVTEYVVKAVDHSVFNKPVTEVLTFRHSNNDKQNIMDRVNSFREVKNFKESGFEIAVYPISYYEDEYES